MNKKLFIGVLLAIGAGIITSSLLDSKKDAELLKMKERVDTLEEIIIYQDDKLKEYQHLERILKDLSAIPEEARPMVIALCFTESSLKYDITHSGRFDRTTTGICGIKPDIWGSVIGDYNPNTLYSGYLVLNHLLEKHDDFYKAVASYKGAKKNFKSTQKAVNLAEKIVSKHYN